MDHFRENPVPEAPKTEDEVKLNTPWYRRRSARIGGAVAGAVGAVVGIAAWLGTNNDKGSEEHHDPTPVVTESFESNPSATATTDPTETASPSTPEISEEIAKYDSMEVADFYILPWDERRDYKDEVLSEEEKDNTRHLWYEYSGDRKNIYPESVSADSSPEDIVKITTDNFRQAISSHNIVIGSDGNADWDKIQNFDRDKAKKLLASNFLFTDGEISNSQKNWIAYVDYFYDNGEGSMGPNYYAQRNAIEVPEILWASELYTLPGVNGEELPARYIEAGWTDPETGDFNYMSVAYVWIEFSDDDPNKTDDNLGTWVEYGREVEKPAS